MNPPTGQPKHYPTAASFKSTGTDDADEYSAQGTTRIGQKVKRLPSTTKWIVDGLIAELPKTHRKSFVERVSSLNLVTGTASPWKSHPVLSRYENLVAPFFPDGPTIKRIKRSARLLSLCTRLHYTDALQRFVHEYLDLEKRFQVLSVEAEQTLDRLLLPDSTKSITNIETLIKPYASMNIKVGYEIEIDSCGEAAKPEKKFIEITEAILDKDLEKVYKTVTFSTFRLYLFLSGLLSTINSHVLLSALEAQTAEEEAMVKKQNEVLELFREKDLTRLKLFTLAVCQAAVKEEIPKYFSDSLYTAMRIVDRYGRALFRSDTIQPRDGWLDLQEFDEEGHIINPLPKDSPYNSELPQEPW